MKRINGILIVAALWVFAMGWLSHRAFNTSVMGFNPVVYSQVDSLKSEIKSKDSLITILSEEKGVIEEQLDDVYDELEFKESEISYWGRRYDSTRIELNKFKRK